MIRGCLRPSLSLVVGAIFLADSHCPSRLGLEYDDVEPKVSFGWAAGFKAPQAFNFATVTRANCAPDLS
jgi:hypothetical protein